MFEVYELPALNATLNGAATILLLSGWACIKMRKVAAHLTFMILALIVSIVFLVSYVTYHVIHGHFIFRGTGWTKVVYYPLLLTHVVLAVVNVPMVCITVSRAARRRFDRHKLIARWTLPVWLYVSVTGVLVYLMCYVWFP